MTGAKALDTGVWIDFLRGDTNVQKKAADTGRMLLPFPVLGELMLGAERSSDPSRQHMLVDTVLEACELIMPTPNVCRRYAKVKASLWSKGKPIPENDIWIAACALECQTALVARDPHFREVDGLEVEVW